MKNNNMQIGLERAQAVLDAKEFGYDINIFHEGDTKFVEFNGKFTKEPYRLRHSYSDEISDQHIREDCAYRLMRWAGLVYETRMTYMT